MIEKIDYVAYRKLKDISLKFSPYVNLIAGTNGTWKLAHRQSDYTNYPLFFLIKGNIDRHINDYQ